MNTSTSRWVQAITLNPPSLKDNTSDAGRLVSTLKACLGSDTVDIDLDLLKRLPTQLRAWSFGLRCVVFKDRGRWMLTHVTDLRDSRTLAGLAIDLGTSRVVLRLVDLASGDTLAEDAFDNPQIAIGPDILTRIHHADSDEGLAELNALIISGLNDAVAALTASCGLVPQDIHLMALAGNTAMTHLFMGLNPHWMIREPYIPVVNRPGVLKAAELGIQVNPLRRILIFPNIGSYFGGDLIAGILSSGLNQVEDPAILVDVGTNAEVVIGNRHWLIACAGAAGPALEGGVTRMGMMAGPGVIDQITINPDTGAIQVRTIGQAPPVGICGSGLIDLAAQLFLAGMIDLRGRLVPATCGERLKAVDGLRHLVVVPASESATGKDLTLSQADLDSLIRSKAAMYTILETISESVGVDLRDLSTFYVAGTFGSFINPRSAISIGMLPDLPLSCYQSLGNSSLEGANRAIRSSECLDEIDAIRDRITYLELNVNQDFMNRFSAAKFLPHTDPNLFPSVQTRSRT